MQHNDILLAIGLVLVVMMMILPLPPMLLDVLLTINLALSVTILLVTLYTTEPLQYSTFPTILLVATLFRLGLNVSSARLILAEGEAGSVIEAFGHFVIGGNYVVGVLMFIILVIINFIVITNGAGRVSEVAARFTLDAMPGKQLSIDAELNSGAIDDKTARFKRKQIQREADFHGTMDGASKFVKGDAIAAIIITVVNIIGGFVIGVMQLGMNPAEAASTFTILSVGDGLVSQIPALLISTATGILVTRVSAEEEDRSLGDDIGNQMFNNPKILGVVTGLMLVMAMVPGMPMVPFLMIASMSGFGCYSVIKADKAKAVQKAEAAEQAQVTTKKKKATTEDVLGLLTVEPLELEIGYRLVRLLEAEHGGDLLERIAQIRRQIALELGVVLPSVRVRDNLQLGPNTYQFKLRGVVVDTGEAVSDRWLAMNTEPDIAEPIEGSYATKEPAFGLPACWILESQKDLAELSGYTVVSASAMVSTHVTEIIKRHASDILSRSDVQSLLDNMKAKQESLVSDLVPDTLSVAEVHRVLQSLLQERVSIRDLGSILDALSYHARVSKDPGYLTEQCRMALSRVICKQYTDPGSGQLLVITLSPTVEEAMAQGLLDDGGLALSPVFIQQVMNGLNTELEKAITHYGHHPVVLCNARLRPGVRKLIERSLPQIGVLSYNEVGPSVKVKATGVVRVESEGTFIGALPVSKAG